VLAFKFILDLFVISIAVVTEALMIGYSTNKTGILQFAPQSTKFPCTFSYYYSLPLLRYCVQSTKTLTSSSSGSKFRFLWVLWKQNWSVCTGFIWLTREPVVE